MVRAATRHPWIWFPAAACIFIAVLSAGCAPKTTEPPAGPASPEVAGTITSVGAEERDGAAVVRVEGSGTLTYTAVQRTEPLGVIFYFPDSVPASDIADVSVGGDLVETVKTTRSDGQRPTARIEIALREDLPYDVTRSEGAIEIRFARPEAGRAAEAGGTPPPAVVAPASAMQAPAGTPLPATAAPAAAHLQSVEARPVENGVRVHVKADGTIGDYNEFTIETPPRIVFDIFHVASPFRKEESLMVNTPWVKRVRHYGDNEKLRVVIDTSTDYLGAYSASPVADGLIIQVTGEPGKASGTGHGDAGGGAPAPVPSATAAPPAAAATAAMTETPEKTAPSAVEPPPAAAAPAPAPPAAASRAAWLNQIDFSGEEGGKSTVIIGTTQPVQYRMAAVNDKLLRLTLLDTNVPEYRKRALITTRFESALDRVTPVQKPDMKKDSAVVFELREAVPYQVQQDGSRIEVHFAASKIPPKPFEAAKLPSWKQVLEQAEPAAAEPAGGGAETAATESDPGREGAPMTAGYAAIRPVKKYTGEKIALDFYETDIKNVFRILREVSGKNFAIDKNVTGRVTLTLDKPVPWDQILDLVLKMNQLGMVEEGDIVRIATLATIRKEDEQRQAAFEAERKAHAAKKAAEPLFTEYLPVNYSNAKNEILPHLKSIVTDRGSVSVDMRNNQIIITETRANIEKARALIKEIDKVTPQVLIEARIVEVNDEFQYAFGLDWNLDAGVFDPPIQGPDGEGSGAIVGVGPQRGYNVLGGTYNYSADMNYSPDAGSTLGFSFTRIFGSPLVINAILSAAETNSEGRIISSPKVLTLDNKKAKIKQGLEFPYLERDDAGGSSVKFKDIDLLLEVTPQVTPDNRISMNIFITKNDVAAIVEGVPAISTNEAETELLVNDGDTIVIGGIFKASTTIADKGWPVLKTIPLVKWLFRTDTENRSNNELLIFITPRIVKLEQREL